MDKSIVQEIIKRNIDPITDMLYLKQWEIDVTVDPCNAMETGVNTTTATHITMDIAYYYASININPNCVETEEEVCRDLIHELCHIVLHRYRTYRETATGIDPALENIIGLFHRVDEQTCTTLERIFTEIYVKHYLKKEENKNEETD